VFLEDVPVMLKRGYYSQRLSLIGYAVIRTECTKSLYRHCGIRNGNYSRCNQNFYICLDSKSIVPMPLVCELPGGVVACSNARRMITFYGRTLQPCCHDLHRIRRRSVHCRMDKEIIFNWHECTYTICYGLRVRL
jgi:hypothetical protein